MHKDICTLGDSDFLRMPLYPTLLPSRTERNQDMTTGLPVLKAHSRSYTTSSVGILGVQVRPEIEVVSAQRPYQEEGALPPHFFFLLKIWICVPLSGRNLLFQRMGLFSFIHSFIHSLTHSRALIVVQDYSPETLTS